MFIKDIRGYQVPADRFYPRPKTHLAAFDEAQGRFALVMEDAGVFATQKVHEHELAFHEVMRMIPALVDVAVAWEGCDQGERADELVVMDVPHWTSPQLLDGFKTSMPGGAPLYDLICCMPGSPLHGGQTWNERLGVSDLATRMTTRLDAFFAPVRPENGATCTLCIDFQQMFSGPVPSDLAYLMNSGSVLPDVYTGENHHRVCHAFYDRFMARTRRYPDYTYDQFVDEYRRMATVQFIYYCGFGSVIAKAGAFENDLGMRIELGGKGATEADLPPEQRRQRMWWTKAGANFVETFKAFGLVDLLAALPEIHDGLGPWVEIPDHLR